MSDYRGWQRGQAPKDEWLTPRRILDALGPFDLDPCASVDRPWPTAARHYTIEDDGLRQPWEGRVWLNPPYGRSVGRWLEKMVRHGNGIALLFARTETRAFFKYVWKRASALLFLAGRVEFCRTDGTVDKGHSPAPAVLVAFDIARQPLSRSTVWNADVLRGSSLGGAFVNSWHTRQEALAPGA